MVAAQRRNADLLAGIRVLDLSQDRTQMCGRILADLGADVVLIEPPGGAASRRFPPLVDGDSLYFESHNANKRGIVLDLDDPAGRADLLRLCGTADVVIETFAPGALAARGLGAAAMRAGNPALTITSITEFGQDGPYRDYLGTNLVHMALLGLLARSGNKGGEPLRPPGQLAYETAAIQAAWATLIGYAAAQQTGLGEDVDVAVFEAAAKTIDPGEGMGGVPRSLATDLQLSERGRPDGAHLFPIMRVADGYVRFAILAPRQWHGMLAMIGDPPELADPRYDEVAARFEDWGTIRPIIERAFASRTRHDLAEEAAARGIPLVEQVTPGEVMHAKHFEQRGAFVELPLPSGRIGRFANGFLEVDGQRAALRAPAPTLGQHTEEVLAEAPAEEPAGARSTSAGSAAAQDADVVEAPILPLAGVRVLDLGVIVMGAELSRLLADMGADVVKVENLAFPDGMRWLSPGGVLTAAIAWGHRNKRGLGLNLRDPRGVQMFLQLVGEADMVLSNFKPGTMEQLGLSYDVLSKANPRIVVGECSALGADGEWSTRMGYGPLVRAACGLTALWAYPERDDGFCDSGTIYPDHAAARAQAVGVLSALLRARRTGAGALVKGRSVGDDPERAEH